MSNKTMIPALSLFVSFFGVALIPRPQAPAPIPLCHFARDTAPFTVPLWIEAGPEWEALSVSPEGSAFHMANHPMDYIIDETGNLTPEPEDDTCPPPPALKPIGFFPMVANQAGPLGER